MVIPKLLILINNNLLNEGKMSMETNTIETEIHFRKIKKKTIIIKLKTMRRMTKIIITKMMITTTMMMMMIK